MKHRFLELAQHTATGIVLTDMTMRFITLKQHSHSVVPEHFAELAVPAGCFDNGVLANKGSFISFLKRARKTHSLDSVSLVLASSQMQTYTLSAKGAGALYVKESVEKLFGLPAKDIAYDYNTVAGNDTSTVFHVSAMPKSVALDIVNAFKSAGITVLTIESIAHALRRDILPPISQQNALIIDIDTTVTSLVFIVRGKVSHTILFAFGDDSILTTITTGLNVSAEEATRLKEEQGLIAHASRDVFDAVVDDCHALVHQINEAYIAWRTEHAALPPIEGIYLTGAGSTLKGFDEYIAANLRVPVQEANVWANCLAFDDHIPALPQHEAVRYAAAIGVALMGGDTINMLPHEHKKALQRKHAARVSLKVFFSFILGLLVGFAVARIAALPTVHVKIMDALHKIHAQW